MGIQEEAPRGAPDTFGLPEYFITDIFTEIAGSNVRIVVGARRSGEVHWLYSAVMPSDLLLPVARHLTEAAQEAFSLMQMMGGKGH